MSAMPIIVSLKMFFYMVQIPLLLQKFCTSPNFNQTTNFDSKSGAFPVFLTNYTKRVSVSWNDTIRYVHKENTLSHFQFQFQFHFVFTPIFGFR